MSSRAAKAAELLIWFAQPPSLKRSLIYRRDVLNRILHSRHSIFRRRANREDVTEQLPFSLLKPHEM